MTRNLNIIDAHDELRRIGPEITAVVRELDRLCARLPMPLVERINAAAPELSQVDLAAIGPKLTALAQAFADEVDALPECRQDALVEQVEARRRASATRPARERAA